MSPPSPAVTFSEDVAARAIVEPTTVKRLLIVRLGAMGDVIHGLPAVAALRAIFPKAIIGWLIEERWAELLCTLSTPRSGPRSTQRPLVDRIHTVNTRQWRRAPFAVATWERIAASFSDLRAAKYEIAIDLQGAARSSLLARWSGAPVIYGAAQPRENLATMFYTRQIITSGKHVVEQNLSLAEAVAHRRMRLLPAELPRDAAAEQECELRRKAYGAKGVALINPGAGWGAKLWPPERYGQVAEQLSEDGLKVLINFGPGEEDLASAVESASNGAAEKFTCTLTQLIALTRHISLFVGGDTGPMHLAAALGVPVVGIFGPTDPARNGPFATPSIVLRGPSSTTSYRHVSQADEGLLEITAAQVVAAARQLLEVRRG